MVSRARTVKIGCVIAAGGRGSFANKVPKVLETLEAGAAKPILVQVALSVIDGGIRPENIVVVVNDESQTPIKRALDQHGLGNIRTVVQYQRLGTANAVACALPFFAEKGVTDFLVMFGDMPRWSGQTVRQLISGHTKNSPVVSLVTIRVTDGCPESLRNYGIVLRRRGQIRSIVEPRCAPDFHLRKSERNPSLYVFRFEWFREVLSSERVRPVGKGDGFTPEFHLSGYIRVACRDGRKVHVFQLPLGRLIEALGVNSRADLKVIREIEAREQSSGY